MAGNEQKAGRRTGGPSGWGAAERDIALLGALALGLLLFAWTSGATTRDPTLTTLVLLNIALLAFGWRRYRQINAEIAERRKYEAQARQLAETDALTGLLNRRSLFAAANAVITASRAQGEAVAMIKIDIAIFRQTSALHEHGAGEAIIRDCAVLMQRQLPETALIARIGENEFAAVLAFDPHRIEQIDDHAAGVIEAICRPKDISAIDFIASTAVGLARSDKISALATDHPAPAGSSTSEELLRQAEIALYHARKRGRNRYFWFEPAMESELRYRNSLETGIRRGLALGEFDPVYTPEIDPRTGEPTAYRMQARWRSATLGEVAPEIFIPVAEDIGLIGELTNRMIGLALADARTWDPAATLVVNISPLQLRDPWFAHHLIRLLTDAGFEADRLKIEITESALHENLGTARALIASISDKGVRVSFDNFGVRHPGEDAVSARSSARPHSPSGARRTG